MFREEKKMKQTDRESEVLEVDWNDVDDGCEMGDVEEMMIIIH